MSKPFPQKLVLRDQQTISLGHLSMHSFGGTMVMRGNPKHCQPLEPTAVGPLEPTGLQSWGGLVALWVALHEFFDLFDDFYQRKLGRINKMAIYRRL